VRYIARLMELGEDLKARTPEDSRFTPPWTTGQVGRLAGGKARSTLLRGFEDTHHWLSQTSGRVPFFPDISQMAVAPDMTATDAAVLALPALRAKADTELGDPAARAFLAGLSEQALQEVAA